MGALTFRTSHELGGFIKTVASGCVAIDTPVCGGEEPALLDAAGHFARQGSSVLILAADEVCAESLRMQAGHFGNLPAQAITTIQERAFCIMGNPQVQQATGRGQRLLDQNEVDVLLEDVKVCGLKPKRLREMLKFFFNSISNCANEDPTWLITSEEQAVYAILEENLSARQALLPYELSALAFRGLEAASEQVKASFGADVVFAVGFDQMSASSMRLARSLAGRLFVATGSNAQTPCAGEPYPHPEGFEALKAEAGVVRCRLEAAGASDSAADAAGADASAKRSCTVSKAHTPAQEFDEVAAGIQASLAKGAAAGDVLVAVPNGAWAARIADRLKAQGVPAVVDMGPAKVAGDPRDAASCGAIAARAFFLLWLDPSDMTALRTWIGLGDWLLCSEAFLEVLAYAKENSLSAAEAIKRLRQDEDEAAERILFHKVVDRLDELDRLRAVYASGNYASISQAFAEAHLALPGEASSFLSARADAGNLTAAELDELARLGLKVSCGVVRTDAAAGNSTAGNSATDAVLIAPYRRCVGRRARELFLTGMVNGFLPGLRAVDDAYSIDERAKALEKDRRLFEALKALPTEELHVSLFEKDRLENVGRLKMEATRVYFEDGIRCARIAPSVFVDEIIKQD